MKKILTITIFLALAGLNKVDAQDTGLKNIKLRHIKGFHSIDARYMYAHLGPAYELNYGYLVTDKFMFHAGAYFETGKLSYSTFDYKNVKIGGSYTLFQVKQRLYFNADVSALVGVMDARDSDLDISDNYFNYAASYGLNVEGYVFNKISLILSADQQYNFKDRFGAWHYNLGAGIRVYLY